MPLFGMRLVGTNRFAEYQLVAVEIGHPELAHVIGLDCDGLRDLGSFVEEALVQRVEPGAEEADAAAFAARALGEMQTRLAKPQPRIGRRLVPGKLDRKAQ